MIELITVYWLELIFFILGGVFFAESQTIMHFQHNPNWQMKPFLYPLRDKFPQLYKWYVSNNWKYENKYIQLLMRFVLSFFKDGFHITFSTAITLFILPFAINVMPDTAIIWKVIALYAVQGIGFNISYHF